MSDKEKALKILLAKNFLALTKLTKRELVKLLNFDYDSFNSTVINQILLQFTPRIQEIYTRIATLKTSEIIGAFSLNQPDFFGLREVLKERDILTKRSLAGYSKRLNESAIRILELKKGDPYYKFITLTDNAFIGSKVFRRATDKIQKFTINTLERTFLTGNPATLGKTELYNQIFNDPILKKTFQENGRWTFELEVFPYQGKYTNYDIEYYSELAARTGASLAEQEAYLVQAKEFNTTLVKFNDTGKSSETYFKEGDRRCGLINGKVFSSIPGTQYAPGKRGTQGASGTWYQYIKDVLSGFTIGHPNCDHIAKPVPAALY